VVRTKVGYTGGKSKKPTYHGMGDHTESIQLEFDPKIISYESLLKAFWESHYPTGRGSRQYMSAIWYHNPSQKQLAEKSMKEYQLKLKANITTVIEPASEFFDAEGYHQKYYLQARSDIMKSLDMDEEELKNSPLACRLNAYVGGHGTPEMVKKDLELLKGPAKAEVQRYYAACCKKPKNCS